MNKKGFCDHCEKIIRLRIKYLEGLEKKTSNHVRANVIHQLKYLMGDDEDDSP